jgi:tRNA-dihydrouridine synthase A
VTVFGEYMSIQSKVQNYPMSIAPMMDRTDRHYRYMMRKITKQTLLYTEMITAKAILHGKRDLLLGYDLSEHPIALQIGGDDPREMAQCAKIAQDFGYDEVNLNIGCPSPRVTSGNFGACLMTQPELVADCVAEMKSVCSIPVTVKHRIGVDDRDRYEDMIHFIEIVSKAEADRFSIHARKAWLQGLSPKQNRNVPPLRYQEIYDVKKAFPHLLIEINGGIKTHVDSKKHLEYVDAVMIGREAYDNPWLYANVDELYFGAEPNGKSRTDVAMEMLPYIETKLQSGTKMMSITRHMLNLFKGERGGRIWRRKVGALSAKGKTDVNALRQVIIEMQHSKNSESYFLIQP